MKPRLYDYAASGNCYKVRLLLAQLGIAYERVPVDIFGGGTLTAEYGIVNPARTTPVLEVASDVYLAESNAILLYLAEGTDMLPSDRLGRAQVYRWLLFEQADVVPTIGGLRFRLLTGRWTAGDPEAVRRRNGALETLELLEQHLEQRDFLVDEQYTVADVAIYGYVHVAHEARLDMGRYPSVREWMERVRSQPLHMNDLTPYPANAAPGAGQSIYD